ncbi:MAG: hypothetical protein WC894_04045 [Patescibacteria group bacterium]
MPRKIDEPRVTIARWVRPDKPLIPRYVNGNTNHGVDYAGGLLKLTVMGTEEGTNPLPIAQVIARAINCFAYNINYYDLSNLDSANQEYIKMAQNYGVWILNYAETLKGKKFEDFQKVLENQVQAF